MQCEPFLWEVHGGCFGRNGIFCIHREGEIITCSWQASCSFASGHLDLPVDDLDGQQMPIWTHCSLNCARQAWDRSTDPSLSAFSGTVRAHLLSPSSGLYPRHLTDQQDKFLLLLLLYFSVCDCVSCASQCGVHVYMSACLGVRKSEPVHVCACMWKSATDTRSLLWFFPRLFIEAGSFPWT